MANFYTVNHLYETGYYAEARLKALNWLKAAPNDALAHYYVATCSYALFNARDDDELTDDDITIGEYVKAFIMHAKLATQLDSTDLKVYVFRLHLAQHCETFQPWLPKKDVITVVELQFLKEKFISLEPKSRNISQCDIEIGLRNGDLDLVCKALQFQIDDSLTSGLPRQQNDLILANLYCKLGYYAARNAQFAAAFNHYQCAATLCTRDYEAIGRAGLLAHSKNEQLLAYDWWFFIVTTGAFNGNLSAETMQKIWAILQADIAQCHAKNQPIPKNCLHSFFELMINTDLYNKPLETCYADLITLCKSQLALHSKHENAEYLLARSYALSKQNTLALQHYLAYKPKPEDLPFFQARFLLQYFAVHQAFSADFTPYLAGDSGPEYYNTAVMLGPDEGYINDATLSANQKLARNHIMQAYYQRSMVLFEDYVDRQLGSAANNDAHIYAMCCHNLALIYTDQATEAAIIKAIATELKGVQASQFDENITHLIWLYNKNNQPQEAKKWSEYYYGDGLNEVLAKGLAVSPTLNDENQAQENGFDPFDLSCYFIDYAGSLRKSGDAKKALEFVQLGLARYQSLSAEQQQTLESIYQVYETLVTHFALCEAVLNGKEAGIKKFNEGLKTKPNSLMLYNNLGYYGYHQHEQFAEALSVYNAGIEKCQSLGIKDDYNYALLLENRASIQFQKFDHYAAALADAEILIKYKPAHYIAYWYAAYSCLMLAQYQKGLAITNTYERETQDGESHLNVLKGSFQSHLGQHAEAVDSFEKAFTLEPKTKADAYYADLYEASKKRAGQAAKKGLFGRFLNKD